jgi:hypothetical protein
MNCPNRNAQGYKDLLHATGNNDDAAHRLWEKNGDNFLDLTPEGKKSKLFEELSKTFSSAEATNRKSLIFSDSFKKFFGKWDYAIKLRHDILNSTEPHLKQYLQKQLDSLNVGIVDENGEPTINALQDYDRSVNPITTYSDNLEENLANTRVKILEILNKQQKIFGNNKRGGKWNEDIKSLIDSINSSPDLDEVNLARLIDDSVKYINATNQVISNLYKLSKVNFKDLSKAEKEELSAQLVRAKEFISTYSILDDINRSYAEAGKTPPEQGKIDQAIKMRSEAIAKYEDIMYSMVGDWILPNLDNLNKVLKEKGEREFSRDVLISSLRMANTDIDYMAYTFGSTINVSEHGAATVALAIKRLVENVRMEDLENQQTLGSLYDNIQGRSKANVAEFNSPYLTTFTVPSKDGFEKRFAIHTPFNDFQFEQNRNEMLKEVSKLPSNLQLAAQKDWYEKNTKLMPNVKQYIDKLKSELTIDEFNTWWFNNTTELENQDYNGKLSHEFYTNVVPGSVQGNKFRIYSGELIIPADQYINTNFRTLYENDSYFKEMYDLYDKSNQKLPFNQRLKFGELPQVHKSYSEAARDAGGNLGAQLTLIKDRTIEGFSLQGRDASYGLTSQSGQEVKNIPVYFVERINSEDVSKDLLSSMLLFSHMANHYSEFEKNEPYILMLKDMVLGNPSLKINPRKITDTKSDGESILDMVTGRAKFKTAEVRVNDRLNQFIDTVVYNEQEIISNMQVFGETISLNKIGSNLGYLTALNTMAANLVGGINNATLGNISTFYGGAGGNTYGSTEWASAQGSYNGDLKNIIGDFSKATPTSKTNLINDYFDSIQGQFQDEFGRDISATTAKRLFSTSTLFFVNNIAEHQIQSVGTLAVLKGKKFTGKAFESKEEYIRRKAGVVSDKKPTTREGLEKYNALVTRYNENRKIAEDEFSKIKENLYDAFESKNGRLVIKDAYKPFWNETDRFNTMNKIHAINKMIHGNYNKFDKSTMQRKALGKLMVMFRKHIYTGFRKRYVREYVDVELADIYEGYYRTFFGKLINDIKAYGVANALTIKYTPQEREAARKTLTEIATIAACMLIMGLLGTGDDDDEPNTFIQNHIALQARRLQQDFVMYLPGVGFPDLFRLINNPAVSTSQLRKFGELINQAVPLYSGGITEQYTRKSGMWDKGDYKIQKKLLDLTPVAGKIMDFLTPEEQIKVYNRPY